MLLPLVIKRDPALLTKTVQRGACLVWTGARDKDGYAKVTRRAVSSTSMRVTRYVYYLIHGRKMPSHLKACHSCDNPSCIHPDHIFGGTHSTNMRDMIKKGRGRNQFGQKESVA